MERLVKQFQNQQKIIFDTGKFDDWCVYLVTNDGKRSAPKDLDYFTELQKIAKTYPDNKLYKDFVSIYQSTKASIETTLLEKITRLSNTYLPHHKTRIELLFTILYAGMIAEENKEKAILKKRIKRLGVHQILIQKHSPAYAANFSKGKNWKELHALMQSLGF
jgi:hypothetical protein